MTLNFFDSASCISPFSNIILGAFEHVSIAANSLFMFIYSEKKIVLRQAEGSLGFTGKSLGALQEICKGF